jgi:glycosyltransferase involved in cell wall biosynthesis
MTRPLVSVIVETINARSDASTQALASEIAPTLEALARQTYPAEAMETIVVLDGEVAEAEAAELRRLHPGLKFIASPASNYFAAKNAGAAAAAADIVAMIDSDAVPAPDWLERLVARFEPGVAAVAGRTRYTGRSLTARIFSIPGFAYVLAKEGDEATGFNLNNVAFRRETLLAFPLDERIARNGGCYLLFHQLRAAGARILYEPRAVAAHGLDIRGLGVVRKQFERGRDSVTIYRLDARQVLRGTPYFRRFGTFALPPILARRLALDWLLMLRQRRQMGVKLPALPFYFSVALGLRTIELAGAMAGALAGPRRRLVSPAA